MRFVRETERECEIVGETVLVIDRDTVTDVVFVKGFDVARGVIVIESVGERE